MSCIFYWRLSNFIHRELLKVVFIAVFLVAMLALSGSLKHS